MDPMGFHHPHAVICSSGNDDWPTGRQWETAQSRYKHSLRDPAHSELKSWDISNGEWAPVKRWHVDVFSMPENTPPKNGGFNAKMMTTWGSWPTLNMIWFQLWTSPWHFFGGGQQPAGEKKNVSVDDEHSHRIHGAGILTDIYLKHGPVL